ncbi:MAG: hypothetical protein AVDCRST_MAG61-1835 [uncultured Friedmanniella sp.]|uniref:Uncharacterized protein n=1 Tax=uncultured Friedmanniella sp. TaxID=335381 RepID=A0A6J4KRD7_9ACTN|nr:MAG: hypothetical protein AVDCRST_MAG61-1835 [uncultured Friedmanniella sp.]
MPHQAQPRTPSHGAPRRSSDRQPAGRAPTMGPCAAPLQGGRARPAGRSGPARGSRPVWSSDWSGRRGRAGGWPDGPPLPADDRRRPGGPARTVRWVHVLGVRAGRPCHLLGAPRRPHQTGVG